MGTCDKWIIVVTMDGPYAGVNGDGRALDREQVNGLCWDTGERKMCLMAGKVRGE